jgi:hypothetical protein
MVQSRKHNASQEATTEGKTMTAAFQQRLDTDNVWRTFAELVVDENYSISGGISWPWFDGSNVWVCDRALLLRFTMFDAPTGEILWPYKSGLWKAPNGDAIPWKPPVQHIGLISPEPCRKEMPVSVAGKPLNCDRLWKRVVSFGQTAHMDTIEEAFEPHRVFNRTFGRRYLWIVSQLPGLKIEVRRGAMQLEFDGGRGVLMGMET